MWDFEEPRGPRLSTSGNKRRLVRGVPRPSLLGRDSTSLGAPYLPSFGRCARSAFRSAESAVPSRERYNSGIVSTLKFAGMLVLNFVVALLATAILETPVYRMVPVHTISAVLWKGFVLSVVLAAFVGFAMWRTWQSTATLWTWTLAPVWLLIGISMYINSGQSSVIASSTSAEIMSEFSGRNCAYNGAGCGLFFSFSIPFIRAVAYSLGAFVSSLIFKQHEIG